MYLSGGTCVTLIIIGGGAVKTFIDIIARQTHYNSHSPPPLMSTVECYLVFTLAAIVLSQFLPNLNSVAKVSLIGAVTAVTYCALILAAVVVQGRGISNKDHHQHVISNDVVHGMIDRVCAFLNGVGIVALAFRGHNLVLEIQGTMPSSGKTPSKVPMWRGVRIAYLVVALCLFPLAIVGHWTYGNLIQDEHGGFTTLKALYTYHIHRASSEIVFASVSLLIVINSLSSFQIYAMPTFDNLELRYTSRRERPCPWWLRSLLRLFFGSLTCFIAVALPFLPSLAGLIGGIALPLTFAYPCFMWIKLRKPAKYSKDWCLNSGLGVSGMVLSVLVVAAAIWSIVTKGIEVHFFKP
ncbi:Lysine histidine transporter-like 8 [Linum grandiflorum]